MWDNSNSETGFLICRQTLARKKLCFAIYVTCVSRVIKRALIRFGSAKYATPLAILRFIKIEINEKGRINSAGVVK